MEAPPNFNPQPFAYHEQIEVAITDLTNLGHGVGRVSGWVVLVPYSLPGEVVRAQVWRNHRNYSEADLVEVLQAAEGRVDPRCPLFRTCGGCQYQHYHYRGQLEWKRRQVQEVMRRLGDLDHEVAPVHPSPREYGYRTKLTPHYEPDRHGQIGPIGFLHASRRQVVDVPQCPIATEAVNRSLGNLRNSLLPRPAGGRRRPRGGTLLLRETADGVVSDMRALVSERVGGLIFRFVAGEFFQNNPFILPALVDFVVGSASADGTPFLVDAYCGVGLFALSAAKRCRRVVGVEISPAAVALARENALMNGIGQVEFVQGSAEAVFAGVGFPPECTTVVMDPPRRGCDPQFLEQFLRYGPRRGVYVSCDPATQARDLKVLVAGGYRVVALQPFDLFPQTRHIECVAVFERTASPMVVPAPG